MTDHLALIHAFFDDTLADEQFDELAAWLQADESHREVFVRESYLHQQIDELLEQRDLSPFVAADTASDGLDHASDPFAFLRAIEADADDVELVDLTDQLKQRELERKRARFLPQTRMSGEGDTTRTYIIPKTVFWGGLAAAIVLLAVVLWPSPTVLPTPQATPQARSEPAAVQQTVCATVIRAIDAQWAGTDPVSAEGQELFRGDHHLEGGMVEVRLVDGACVVLEAPVSFELNGTNSILLKHGRLVANVPASAYGFTVDTPTARVVDYGTEFGVYASDQQPTEVHVFSGEVQAAARVRGKVVGPRMTLTSFQASSIGHEQALIERISFAPNTFKREVVRRVKLIDLIVGGDGAGSRQGVGIDATNGRVVVSLGDAPVTTDLRLADNGDWHAVPARRHISGVFVPAGRHVQITRSGAFEDRFPEFEAMTYGYIWAGLDCPMPQGYTLDRDALRSRFAAGVPGHTDGLGPMLFMHAPKGIAFDLEAIRADAPGLEPRRLTLAAAHVGDLIRRPAATTQAPGTIDLWVYIDGQEAHQTTGILVDRGVVHLDLSIPAGASELTIVSSVGAEHDATLDWLVLNDPVIEMRPKAQAASGND